MRSTPAARTWGRVALGKRCPGTRRARAHATRGGAFAPRGDDGQAGFHFLACPLIPRLEGLASIAAVVRLMGGERWVFVGGCCMTSRM